MMKKTILFLCAMYASQSYASLTNIGNGLIYDSLQDLTWVQDPLATITEATDPNIPGLLFSPTLTPDGRINFGDRTIITNLNGSLLNPDGYKGVRGWRRPTTVSTITGVTTIEAVLAELTGTNVNGELANLFRDNTAAEINSVFTNANNKRFWAGNQQLADPAHGVFSNNGVLQFDTGTGEQVLVNRLFSQDYGFVWAVHSGRVSAVPLPPSIFLFISGLLPFYIKRFRIKKT
jgi:hypothetical protein